HEIERLVLAAQVAQAIEPHPRGKTPVQLAFGFSGFCRPRRRHRAGEVAVARVDERLHSTVTVLSVRAHRQSNSGRVRQTVAETPVTCLMPSPLATSAAPPSPTKVDPCMAARIRGCSAARFASCRLVFSV